MKKPLIVVALLTLFAFALPAQLRAQDKELVLVGYAVAGPVYAKIIPAFQKHWKAQSGEEVKIKPAFGPSGERTRAVIGGLEADVMIQNMQSFVDQLVTAGIVNQDWASRLPNQASPASSVVALIVREGNPKQIKTWTDLTKDGVNIVAINPKTSGNARWGVVAGFGSFGSDKTAAQEYVQKLVKNTKTLASGGREATDTFVKNGIGDVLLTFENEAKFADKVAGKILEYVVPETNIRTDYPVAVLDKLVDKRGTRKVAEAFVAYLFTPEAQQIFADFGYRPFDKALAEKTAKNFAPVSKLITIDELGGWKEIDKILFADGALYDQAQAKGK